LSKIYAVSPNYASLIAGSKPGQDIAATVNKNSRVIDEIAVIPISGFLSAQCDLEYFMGGGSNNHYAAIREHFEFYGADVNVKAVLIDTASGGGDFSGCSELAEYIRWFSENVKPVYGYNSSEALSAMYYLLSATKKIYSHKSAFSGSVGVLAICEKPEGKKEVLIANRQSPDKTTDIDTEEGQEKLKNHLDYLYNIFAGDVARYRGKVIDDVVIGFGQGDMVNAEEAVKRGMIDHICNFDETLELIKKEFSMINVLPSSVKTTPGIAGKNKMRGKQMSTRNKFVAGMVLVDSEAAGETPAVEVTIDIIRQQFPDIAKALIDEGQKLANMENEEIEEVAETADMENPAEAELVAKAKKREITANSLAMQLLKAKASKPDPLKVVANNRQKDNFTPPANTNADDKPKESGLFAAMQKRRVK
jgi:ClpP class serine protease